ncbi:response regulator [Caulobacter sp.]|uniref:response regulator n=1 Tax=Caulobacter sp. TaxID=78 RepID=UPI001B017A75|nr:response regulator [Caulobacter sp.]MBO9546963.1 response regulator [Caulobacter sp.]
MRVLFVDDNAMNRLVVKSMLSAAEVEMAEADNAEAGLSSIETQHFDVVLMDYRMPGMDGLAAIRAIRARPDAKAQLPLLLVTADEGLELRAQAIAAGADDLLRKPVQMQALFDAIAMAMAKGPSGEELVI